MMGALTPASADDLPPLGELIVDDPFWRYPAGAAREGIAHLRVWLTAGPEPGYLAAVTETGRAESAGRIWAVLDARFGPSLVLLEHHLAPDGIVARVYENDALRQTRTRGGLAADYLGAL